MNRRRWMIGCGLAGLATWARPGHAAASGAADPAAARVWSFAVLNQRTVAATAELWNPILQWVSRRSGVHLTLAMGKTAVETTERTVAGAFDFAYTNHLFTPERRQLGWRVLVRFNRPAIHGQIVVPSTSPLGSLVDLQGKTVVFPSREAVVAYHAPRQALHRAGVRVVERFASHQEAAMHQLVSGAADAAGVNDTVMRAYALREGFRYRALWTSAPFPDLPVMVHPRVPNEIVARVQAAFLAMDADREGRRILDDAGALLAADHPLAFVRAHESDYDVYRALWASAPGVAR
ncbi:phosphate/phosphite/phosphonate ABC transporter substrate-binding protein [Tibeticola sp.]|uniref:phosphate/phosphite/phosphonate ABC transporter substrate-binding protein n=1 Tax=Tibeticola sp. TaxID=2005368 RepID=UPI00258B1A27|nr:phosphate/phosphite/phosphonate ABC transporter substrate-binding protein [Tibeticola sp.]MCI4439907.1 phosphate/phosphite/phosphonate ABC transporter substrate-binding protein [Tibeticola sp.]